MAELLTIVPTRSRPGNVERVIKAWWDTDAFAVADLLVAYDADDPRRAEYAAVIAAAPAGVRGMELPTWLPMVHKLDVAARENAGRHWALGFAGDDHLPRTINWARTYLDQLRDLGTGIVYGDDGYQGANCPTQWAMTADIVRALGRMVPAPVEHMYSDVSLLDLGRAAECIRYLPDVLIEHMHPIVRKADNDEQYKRVNSRDQFRRDRLIHKQWIRSGLPNDAAAVRALREESHDDA
ncbi:MAG TPA: hypothetical protein VF062_06545 [Candidatus Limnocylindrales bacterium]